MFSPAPSGAGVLVPHLDTAAVASKFMVGISTWRGVEPKKFKAH